MTAIIQKAARLRLVKDRMHEFIAEVLRENATLIEDMIIMQLSEGTDGDGNTLPDYSPVSVHVYGKPPGPIKLYDTGSFYRNVFLDVFSDAFDIGDRDSKTKKLITEYGAAILKLSDEHRQQLIDAILAPQLAIKVHTFMIAA